MFRLFGGSKLLNGIWSHSVDGGRSAFELLVDGEGDRSDRDSAVSDVEPPSDHCSVKYYTPFGSGVSLGDLTCSQPTNKSCWSTESCESHNGVIGKPLSTNSSRNKITTDKSCALMKSLETRTAKPFQEQGMAVSSGRSFGQSRNSRNADIKDSAQPRNGRHQLDAVGYPGVSNYHAEKAPSLKSTGIPKDGKCIAAEQHDKQLIANQQLFMRELSRLPPDLRKQYVDYMIASHLGLLPAACPPVPAVPAVYYNVPLGPGAVPVTQLVAQPVIMSTGPLMPAPLITVQPVVPSPVTKTANR